MLNRKSQIKKLYGLISSLVSILELIERLLNIMIYIHALNIPVEDTIIRFIQLYLSLATELIELQHVKYQKTIDIKTKNLMISQQLKEAVKWAFDTATQIIIRVIAFLLKKLLGV